MTKEDIIKFFDSMTDEELKEKWEKYNELSSEKMQSKLDLVDVSQRSELLAFKRFISKTPLAELELYSDEEFTDLYIKANCG